MASLYSDFSLQRHTNPDGYSANLAAWHDVLQKAVRAGLVPSDTTGPDILSLRTGEELLRALETKNEGRPLSLGIVIVGNDLESMLISEIGETHINC